MKAFEDYLNFGRRKVTNASYSRREVSVSEFIPYQHHFDKETIITKSGELMQTIRLEGWSFETADDSDVDMKKVVRNSLLKSLSNGNYAAWFHTVRRKKSAYPGGEFTNKFAHELNEQWRKKHSNHESYVNELYITVVRREDTEGLGAIGHYINVLSNSVDEGQKHEAMREAQKELKEITHRLLASLRDYNPRLLTCVQTQHGVLSQPLQFLGMLVNGGQRQQMLVPTMDISHYLSTQRLYFGNRAIELRGLTKTRFAGMISVREYAPATAAGLLDAYLQLPFEFIITQSFSFVNRTVAIGKMRTQQNRMASAEDAAVSQIAEINAALDMAMGGNVAFGDHHCSVMVIDDNLTALEDSLALAISKMVDVGIAPVREKMILEQCYWAQLPGNFSFIGRPSKINTMNLAGFVSMHNYPTGRIKKNHWGDAVTVFDTTSGTPYFFNFHTRDVGHTTIIGPTGAGKTVLMNFLCAQAQKFNCRLFMFDKDRGAEIFVRAIGGAYSVIQPSERCGFNPLHLPDTNENRNFISEWLESLVRFDDKTLEPEEVEQIQEAVNGNYKLAKKDRMLRNVAAFFGVEKTGSIASRLKPWYGEGRYARIFDNPYDALDFTTHSTFGFEMGEVLSDKSSLAPVLLYLFHKVNLSLDGTPTVVVLDEAWALIDNPIFAGKIKDWLKTMRKLNAMVIFATQSVEDAVGSSISDTLIQQTATQIFLPNAKATAAYQTAFMLSDREFNLLKTTDPSSRYFLLKQGKDVVIARIDLSGMDEEINVLSARAETVRVLDQVRSEVGDNPAVFLPIFQQRLREGAAN
ncbi:MAG: VirB4 family type IV secretion/conjugal transfer ATPase [Rickettsiales bacterium]|nr:VirB4 family type IV secretion/conjugal transfer ATPase [Rickettsiales bacterium]